MSSSCSINSKRSVDTLTIWSLKFLVILLKISFAILWNPSHLDKNWRQDFPTCFHRVKMFWTWCSLQALLLTSLQSFYHVYNSNSCSKAQQAKSNCVEFLFFTLPVPQCLATLFENIEHKARIMQLWHVELMTSLDTMWSWSRRPSKIRSPPESILLFFKRA